VDVQGIETLVSLRLESSQLSTELDVSKLTSLTKLNLSRCTALPAVTGISKLAKLNSLNLYRCNSLRFSTSSDADGTIMTALKSLEVSSNSALTYFQRQQLPLLRVLNVHVTDSITTLDCSSWLSLTRLSVHDCSNLTTLQGLDKLSSLEVLRLSTCPLLDCLPELCCFKTLRQLSVLGCTNLGTIHNKLTDFEALRSLHVVNSGIGTALTESTHNNLSEQVSAFQRRHGVQHLF
jgi:internalin A